MQRPCAKIIIKSRGTGIPVSRFGKITASVGVFGGGYFFTLIVMRILQKEIVTRIIVSPPFGLTPFPFWDGLALRSANRFSLVLLVSPLYHRSRSVVYFISGDAGFKSFCVIFRSFFVISIFDGRPTHSSKKTAVSRDPLETLWRFIYVAALSKSAGGVFVLFSAKACSLAYPAGRI